MAPLVRLRRATVEDAAEVAAIWYPGWCDAHLGNVPQRLVDARPEETFEPRAVEHAEHTTVALAGDEIAGFVMVVGDEVEQVYVAAAHRGSGVAAALLSAAEREVAAGGHERAWLAVVAGNERARRFYERRGWVDEGLFEHRAPHPDGPIPVPAHRYVKQVR
ncbi:Ribosomal protein S18 acetylase RimI [Lentzea xinjiangensis]|uniref:Ribosomal protein S18 acetylase RimI n=1 Tax=Lentzea xinjiangensis TaxID=402600 RepID=A0A1H9GCU8_9PSEU|nr:GNAT family N-acetyltransferase [Lentzea xinjiangensis]SEQ47924.1 Ribosomal protein S18 acetylase RimI [Lentzea xinjiangensis]